MKDLIITLEDLKKGVDPVGKIVNADCLEAMKYLPGESIDLVITSPPYENLRTYKGYVFNFEGIAKELFRVMKEGGVVVWIVADQTVNGSESGTSFKQALYFKEQCGFNLHDTMIYMKDVRYFYPCRYGHSFEYMFVFSKGKPKTFNPIKRKNLNPPVTKIVTERKKDGNLKISKYISTEESPLYNVWYYSSGYMKTTKDKIAYQHPAIFPDQLAYDHIVSWSNKEGIILDPMCGSGTVGKMAEKAGRKWIMIDIALEYCQIAAKRIREEKRQKKLPLIPKGDKQ